MLAKAADRVLQALRAHALGRDAAIVGTCLAERPGTVILDTGFGRRLLEEGSRVLSGYALPAAAKAAIVSGDLAWIEKETGELTREERAWLDRRLESETW